MPCHRSHSPARGDGFDQLRLTELLAQLHHVTRTVLVKGSMSSSRSFSGSYSDENHRTFGKEPLNEDGWPA